jgi:hypothetical protein
MKTTVLCYLLLIILFYLFQRFTSCSMINILATDRRILLNEYIYSTYSIIYTLINCVSNRHRRESKKLTRISLKVTRLRVKYTRMRAWFLHEKCGFHTHECDCHTHECNFNTRKCNYHKHEFDCNTQCDIHTQISTRSSVISTSTSVVFIRTRVI